MNLIMEPLIVDKISHVDIRFIFEPDFSSHWQTQMRIVLIVLVSHTISAY